MTKDQHAFENVDDMYPLVPLQRGMLFHSVRAEEGGEYFEQLRLRVRGVVEPETFRWAWDVVVRRHEALRTGFVWEGVPEPVQVVRRQVAVPWVEEDWRALAPTVQQARLRTWLAADRAAGFDLAQAPLLRLRLIRVEHAEYEFVWSHHHLLLDGWSAATVLTEVLQLYGGRRRGSAVQLGRPRRYRTYVEWLARQEMGAAEGYWRQQLAGVTATRWRSWHRECEVKTGALTQVARRVPHATTAAVAAFAREQAVTPSAVVAAAWGLVLCRWGSGRDVVFGMTVAGRPAELAGIEQMVGLFINTVPVRVQVDEGAAIGRWVQEVHRAQLARQPYEWAPLPEVQRWSGVEGPLFDTLLVYENYPVDDALRTQTEVEVTEAELIERTSYAVAATAVPGPELQLQLMGDAGRLSGAEATQLVEDWTTVLTQLVEKGATARVAQVALGADAAATGAPQYDAAAAPSVPALFAAQAARTPDAVAIVDGSCAITYGVLNARAAQLARHLERYGVAADVPVGVFLPAGIDALVAFLGCWKAGGTYVPIDIDSPLDRMAAILGGLDVRVVISDPTLSDRIPGAYGIVEIASPEIALESGADAPSAVTPTQVAYILYTSGSSGQPKGVMVTHDGLGNYVEWARGAYQVTEATWSPLHTSLCFDLSVTSWLLPLVAGGTVEIVSRNAGLASIAERLPHRAGAVVKLTPGQLRVLTDLLPPGARAHVTATLVVGGEPLVSDDVAPWIGRSGLRINNEYGPTETVVGCAVEEVTGESVCDGNVAIGRAIARTTLTVVDDALRPVPAGVPGELLIGGAGVGRGYVGRPDLTAERFVPDPADALGRRAYRTGDLVRRRLDGRLEYLGRLDTQVKIRGYRVELGEVEEALRAHPSVAAAAVLVDGDDRRRELVAYVAPRSGAAVTGAALTMWLTAKLPDYMVPPRIIVVVEIPLTPNGKVNRQALLRLDTSAMLRTSIPPRTMAEELLAGIWAAVLDSAPASVDDDFFTAGGDSLRAMQVVGRIREAFNVEVPLDWLFDTPTIAGLAGRLDRLTRESLPVWESIDSGEVAGRAPASYGQERLWFLEQLVPDNDAYHIHGAFRISGSLDVHSLEFGLNAVVARHEVLRTTFQEEKGRLFQTIWPERRINIAMEDLTVLSSAAQEHHLRARIVDIIRMPFDLQTGPLVRAHVFKLEAMHHALVLTAHHIVADGWSVDILCRELTAAYSAAIAGEDWTPGKLPVQYRHYAGWQRRLLEGGLLAKQLQYWEQQLAGSPVALTFPTDRPRSRNGHSLGAAESIHIPAATASALKRICHDANATLFVGLMAVFQALLGRYTGERDVVIGTDVAYRPRPQLEHLIGFFVNTLPIRTVLSDDLTFRDLIRCVRESTIGAYSHQDVDFKHLVERLRPVRSASHHPFFQVLLTLERQGSTLSLGASTAQPLAIDAGAAPFDISVSLAQVEDGLSGRIYYDAALFDAPTIRRIAAHFRQLLEAAILAPDDPIDRLRLAEEPMDRPRRRTPAAVPPPDGLSTIHQFIEAHAQQTPSAIAVVCGQQRVTYGQLNGWANRIASDLTNLGVGPEERVGICVPSSLELVAGALAIMKTGAACVPVELDWPFERLQAVLADARAKVMVTTSKTESAVRAAFPVLRMDWHPDRALDIASERNLSVSVDPQNLASIIYGSGSAQLAGVMVPHASVVRLFAAFKESVRLAANDVWAMFHSPFEFSLWEIWGALITGGRAVVLSDSASKDGDELLRYLSSTRATILSVSPAEFRVLLTPSAPLPAVALRLVVLKGEPLDPHILQLWTDSGRTEPTFASSFGTPETGVHTAWHRITPAEIRGETLLSAGHPIDGMQVHLLDRHFQPIPGGAVGEIYVTGAGLARGYAGRPELTADRFVPDPSDRTGGRMYRTGVLGRYRVDGELELLGRTEGHLNIRGFRIDPREVERELDRYPGVRQSVVVTRKDADGESQLVAAYVPSDGAAGLGAHALRSFLKNRLPDYMIPYAFAEFGQFPLTRSGDIDRRAIAAADLDSSRTSAAFEAPRGPIEERLAVIWRDILGVEQVGAFDNFFEIGGYSLLATRVVSAIRSTFGVDVPLRTIFETPTLEGVARGIVEHLVARDATHLPDLIAEARRSSGEADGVA